MADPSPQALLQQYWGFDSFRPLQAQIIDSVLQERDTLALLPTGGGKSICFQIPGLSRPGLTLVVSPLISLMKDQVERLNRMGIAATSVTSDLSAYHLDQKLQGAMEGRYRFLYLSPERLQSEVFRLRLPKMPVRLLAVDEAHCISQWGHDFRPAYREIASIREQHPRIPIIALTASATPQVQKDIESQLGLRDPARFTQSFARPNLRYFVLEEERVRERMETILSRTQGSAIVYVRTRKMAEAVAQQLVATGIQAEAYHGGMASSLRHAVQERWQADQARVVVATNAFGMGIDKPNVRLVLHYQVPADLESYYQEAGRAGRDGQTALAIAFANPADLHALQRWNQDKYPTWEQLSHHFQVLCNHFQIGKEQPSPEPRLLDISRLARDSGSSALSLYRSLAVLAAEGLIGLSDDQDDYAYLQILMQPQDLWAFKQRNPGLAPVLDHLLRSLGGAVYTKEIRLLPFQWQDRLSLPPSQWDRIIGQLAQREVIAYQPPRGQPTIRFFVPRHVLHRKHLNWEKYEFLRTQSALRLEQMLAYLRRQDACRSQLIQGYFGEEDTDPCGVCDVCIGRYRKSVSDSEYQTIQGALIQRVRQGPISYRELLVTVQVGSPAQREKVLRYLLDKMVIQADSQGFLQLPS